MYRAIGTVQFLTNEFKDSYPTNGYDRIKVIDVQENNTVFKYKVTCKFDIYLNEDSSCLTKNDYGGKVHPYLDLIINPGLILNTQIYNLNYKNVSLKRIDDLFFKEETKEKSLLD